MQSDSINNTKVSEGLKKNLLAEYQRQATDDAGFIQERLNTSGDNEDQARRLQGMEERERRERYIDIVNVHAAALNASNLADERPQYRSLDDNNT